MEKQSFWPNLDQVGPIKSVLSHHLPCVSRVNVSDHLLTANLPSLTQSFQLTRPAALNGEAVTGSKAGRRVLQTCPNCCLSAPSHSKVQSVKRVFVYDFYILKAQIKPNRELKLQPINT